MKSFTHQAVQDAADTLVKRLEEVEDKASILRSIELKALYDQIKTLAPEERAGFGQEVNELKSELQQLVAAGSESKDSVEPIDVTAPFDVNVSSDKRPRILSSEFGSKHPLMKEIQTIADIFYRMGFNVEESRQLDDEHHMFTALNFPEGHPARDDYDTFMTEQKDKDGNQLVAPAHTSTMQNRLLQKYRPNLESGNPIAVLVPDRVFRNEDLDARHEHTFYQAEGIYVDKGIHVGHLLATLKIFLQEYYNQELDVKTQPYYFPFTEPSFEFAMSCPFCQKKGCHVCSHSGWIELLGCGMIHPNVLEMAGIDSNMYTGFAWGCGIDRLVMMKYGIEDVRHFESGKIEFLRQFA